MTCSGPIRTSDSAQVVSELLTSTPPRPTANPMVPLHEHVILEIARYLDVSDLLSLALSSRIPFQTSQLYSFWRPHELDSSCGLSSFLPIERLGPWKSYSGDDIRVAVMKMRRSRENWQSEGPVAKYRVLLTAEGASIRGISGTRWLCCFRRDSNSLMVHFIDGRTGHKTAKGIDIVPPGTNEGEESPVVISLGPDEILIGTSGENDDDKWDFVLFRVKLFYETKDGTLKLDFYQTRVNIWQNVPPYPMATANSRFLVLRSDYAEPPDDRIRIYDIHSNMSCGMQQVEDHTVALLRDDWYLMDFDTSGELYLVAIHLPSLLVSGKTIEGHELPDGIGVPTGGSYGGSSVKVSPSINRFPNKSEYSVMLHTSSAQFTFDIRVEVVAGSIYGQIDFVGQRNRVLTDKDLQRDAPRGPLSLDERYLLHHPIQLSPSCQGPLALLAGYGTGNNLGTLYVADYRPSIPFRCVEWRASIRHHGKACSDDTKPASEAVFVRWIPYWDPNAGIMLLREAERLEPGIVHQACWF